MGDQHQHHQDRERVKNRLREAISLLCKSGLRFQDELCVEGLIGITLDRDDVFLVSIREIINGDERTLDDKPLSTTKEEEIIVNNHSNDFEVYADEPEEISAEDAWSTPVSRASPQSADGDRPSSHTPNAESPKNSLVNNHTNGSLPDTPPGRPEPKSEHLTSRKRSLSPTSSCKSPCPKSPAILKQPPNIYTKSHLKPAHTPTGFPHFPINRSGSFDSLWSHHNDALNLKHANHTNEDLHNSYYDVAFNFTKRKPNDIHPDDLPKAEDLSQKTNNKFRSTGLPSENSNAAREMTRDDDAVTVKEERADSDNDDSFISESEDTNMSGSNERLCADALASSHTAMMNLASMGLPTFVPMSLAQLHQTNSSLSALQAALGSPPLNSSMAGLGLGHLSSPQPSQHPQQQASPSRTAQQLQQHQLGSGSGIGGGGETICSNCSTNKTTVWRRNAEGHLVCNACGLYYKLHQLRSPVSSSSSSVTSRTDWICANCGTSTTTMWRRNAEGFPVCNPCGLYYKLHKVNRPLTLVKPRIHSRRRKPKSYYYEVGGQGGSGLSGLSEGGLNLSEHSNKPKTSPGKKYDEEALMEMMSTARSSAGSEPPTPSVPNFPTSMPAFPDRE